jgi:hypothetical protein
MKVIDLSPKPPEGNSLNALIFNAQKTLGDAFGLNQDIKAQDTFITQLGRSLNNRFILIRNFKLVDPDIVIPFILIGPTGFSVIYTSTIKGVFQAKNETWSIVSKSNRYEPARPNLITRTGLMTRAVEAFLKKQGQSVPEIQGVLFFSNPGVHVDAQRPAVRIVLMDGVERFATGLLQGELSLEREEVQNLVTALTEAGKPEKKEEPAAEETGDISSKPKSAGPPREAIMAKNFDAVSRKLPLTTRQWVLLGIMAFVEVIILVVFIIIILTTS